MSVLLSKVYFGKCLKTVVCLYNEYFIIKVIWTNLKIFLKLPFIPTLLSKH